MTVECIFFDCDGTLVDSEMLCTQAYANSCSRLAPEICAAV